MEAINERVIYDQLLQEKIKKNRRLETISAKITESDVLLRTKIGKEWLRLKRDLNFINDGMAIIRN